jgi:internalin A
MQSVKYFYKDNDSYIFDNIEQVNSYENQIIYYVKTFSGNSIQFENKILYIKSSNLEEFLEMYKFKTNITRIDIDSESNLNIPDDFTNLKTIYIQNSKLETLKDFEKFVLLEDLLIKNSKIRYLSDVWFPKLVQLNLSGNNVYISDDFHERFQNLTMLQLNNCKLTEIPESILKLNNLTELYLENNRITKLPNSIVNLNQLEILLLNNNLFDEISEDINKLEKLEMLELSNNRIKIIPEFSNLIHFEDLKLGGNDIEEITGLDKLENLMYLNLEKNRIKKIQNLKHLSKLKSLNLSHNLIEDINELSENKELELLELDNNYIRNCDVITNLVNLQYIVIKDNLIKQLPLLISLKELISIHYSNNLFDKIDFVNQIILINNLKKDPSCDPYLDTIQLSDCHSKSILNLMKDKYTFTKEELFIELEEENVKSIDIIKSFFNETDSFEVGYYDIFIRVWNRICNTHYIPQLVKRLDSKMKESVDYCFMGKVIKLLEVLYGVCNDIYSTDIDIYYTIIEEFMEYHV